MRVANITYGEGSLPIAIIAAGLMGMGLTEYIAVASLALNIGIAAVGATWGLAKIKDAVRDAMDTHRKEFEEQIAGLRRETVETMSAQRQKLHEIELWARDMFVRRDSFLAVIAEVKTGFADLGARLEKRLERMETKIDEKT